MTLTEARQSNLPDRVKALAMTITKFPATVTVGRITKDSKREPGIPVRRNNQVVAYRTTQLVTREIPSEEVLINAAKVITLEDYLEGNTLAKYKRALAKLMCNKEDSEQSDTH